MQVFGFIAFVLHIAFAARETATANGLPKGEHLSGAIAGYGIAGIVLLLFCTCFDFAILHFGWRKYIAFWWMFELFGLFLICLTTGAMSTGAREHNYHPNEMNAPYFFLSRSNCLFNLATVILDDGLTRSTLAFDILFGIVILTILVCVTTGVGDYSFLNTLIS